VEYGCVFATRSEEPIISYSTILPYWARANKLRLRFVFILVGLFFSSLATSPLLLERAGGSFHFLLADRKDLHVDNNLVPWQAYLPQPESDYDVIHKNCNGYLFYFLNGQILSSLFADLI
jgi:hypothetical protein